MMYASRPAPGSPLAIGIVGFTPLTTTGTGGGGAAASSAGAAGVSAATSAGTRRRFRRGRFAQLSKQQRLVGIETLAARSIETTQQLIQTLPQGIAVAALLLERGQQFQNHPLEGGRVIRQLLDRRQRVLAA